MRFRSLPRWVVCAVVGALVAAGPATPAGAGLRAGPGGDIAIAQPTGLVTADMNGDGHDDVVMASASGVDVLLGDGAGRLVPTTEISVGAPVTMAVTGDFNGDDHTDVAVATSGGAAHVLLGDGHGGLQEASGSPLPDTAGQVAAADFNGDGLDDLALSDYFVGVRIRLADGTGGFTEAAASPVAAIGTHPYELLAGDFDRDGVADLVVRDALAGTLRSYHGTGTGDFTAMSPAVSAPDSASAHVLRSADLNADGHLDLLVAPGSTSSIVALLGDAAGHFTPAPVSLIGPAADVVVADFNGDGHLDIATSDRDFPGFVYVHLGDGTGTFRDANFGHGPLEWHPYHLTSGDFDGDGHPDVAAGVDDPTNSIDVLLNEPTPTISTVTSAHNPSSPGELVTLTVTVTALAGTATPAGTVTFYDGAQPVGTGYIASFIQNHSATYTAGNIALATGDHIITARFSGDDALAPVVSAPFTQTVLAQTPPTTGPTPTPPGPRDSGYWMLSRSGAVYAFGGAVSYGNAPVGTAAAVDIERTTSGNGYWVLDDRGDVFPRGDAHDFGGVALLTGERAVSLSATRDSGGYWVFTDRGRVITRGNAVSHGDMAGTPLKGPVRDSVATPSGNGYWMVASDGGIFSFGDARFAGSMGAAKLNKPVMSMAGDPDGDGYWLVASDGGIFAFHADFHGSMGNTPLNKPVSGIVPGSAGYLMVAEDGGIFAFGDVAFHGSLVGKPQPSPLVSVTLLPARAT